MDIATFKAAGEFARDHDMGVFIGGGEPTLHPQFWEIAGLCMYYNADYCRENDVPPVNLVTNGSRTEHALALAHLAEAGFVSARLSRDQFHMQYHIDDDVVQAFKRRDRYDAEAYTRSRDDDNRSIGRDIINILPIGRAKLNGWTKGLLGKQGCDSCGAMVTPDGKIWRCACKKEQLGTVFKPAHADWYEEGINDGCTTRDGRLVADMSNGDLLISRSEADSRGLLLRGDIAHLPQVICTASNQDLPEAAAQLTETKEGVAL